MKNQFVVTSFLGFISLFFHSPAFVKMAMYTAIWLFILDTVTGLGAAGAAREAKSETFRVKLAAKLRCYAIIIGILYAATVGLESWIPMQVGWVCVSTSEVLSLVENLNRFQKYSGVNLGAFGNAIQMAVGFFQAGQPSDRQKVITTSTLVQTDSEPMVVTTTESMAVRKEMKKP